MLNRKLNLIKAIELLNPDNILWRIRSHKASTIKLAELDPEIDEAIKKGQHYKRLKSFRPKIEPSIPAYLELTANHLIKEKKTSNFRKEVDEAIQSANHLQLPPEKQEIQVFTKEIEAKFVAREKSNIADYTELGEDEKMAIYIERNKKIEQSVRKKIFSWKEYDWSSEHKAMVYMASRLAPNYIATRFVFNEIKHIDPDFKPKTLFDFGSGIGTTMHVANEMWPASIHEHINIEKSKEMIDLCDLILKNGNDKNPTIFNNVFYKQFMPVGRQTTYDLVVSAFTLKEQPNVDARIHAIESLWHKAADILVFIEHGNQAGTAAILEARSFILKMNGYDPVAIYSPQEESTLDQSTINPDLHIMAPCPHHYVCPRLNRDRNIFCNFNVFYFPLNYSQPVFNLQQERFSYVVLRKRPKIAKNFPAWPRVVQKPKKSKRLVNLKLCTPEGKIEHLNVSKGKHTTNAYDCARACKWGDQYPSKINEIDKYEYKLEKNAKFFFKRNPKPSSTDDSESSETTHTETHQ